jgi:prepilin peptidase CpaA
MLAVVVLVGFVLLMTCAAVSDVRSYTIPNALVIAVCLLFLLAILLTGMPVKLAVSHLLAGMVLFLCGFALYSAGVIGGGDAKLLAAVALWMGWSELPPFLFYTAIAGGLVAVGMVIWEVFRTHFEITGTTSLYKRLASLKPNLPYGVAIAAGACATLPRSWWASALPVNL